MSVTLPPLDANGIAEHYVKLTADSPGYADAIFTGLVYAIAERSEALAPEALAELKALTDAHKAYKRAEVVAHEDNGEGTPL